jgi:hypothetical protein
LNKKKAYKIVTIVVAVVVAAVAVWIMATRQGLADGLDFGAGAYYYADIPGYDEIAKDDVYKTSVPYWLHVVLFLGWGWLMYRLWIWIDKRK